MQHSNLYGEFESPLVGQPVLYYELRMDGDAVTLWG